MVYVVALFILDASIIHQWSTQSEAPDAQHSEGNRNNEDNDQERCLEHTGTVVGGYVENLFYEIHVDLRFQSCRRRRTFDRNFALS